MRYIFVFLAIPIVVGVFSIWYYFVEFICDITGVSEIYIDLPIWIAVLFPFIFVQSILPYIKKSKNIPTDNNSNEKKNSSSYIETEKRKKRERELLLKKIIEEKSK